MNLDNVRMGAQHHVGAAMCFNTQSIKYLKVCIGIENEHGLFMTLWAYAADPQCVARGAVHKTQPFCRCSHPLLRIGEARPDCGVPGRIS